MIKFWLNRDIQICELTTLIISGRTEMQNKEHPRDKNCIVLIEMNSILWLSSWKAG